MHKFSVPLVKGEDPATGLPVLGVVVNNQFISKPFLGGHAHSKVDATAAYGLTPEDAAQLVALNKLLDTATQNALDAGCLAIQEALDIESGDFAAIFFSGYRQVRPIAEAMADYIRAEYARHRE